MKMYELLNKPERWTKGHRVAYRSTGCIRIGNVTPETVESDDLCCCLVGAMETCYDMNFDEVYDKLSQHLKGSIVAWNDAEERTYEEVISVLKELDI